MSFVDDVRQRGRISFRSFFFPRHYRNAQQIVIARGVDPGCSKKPTSPSGKYACAGTGKQKKESGGWARMSGCEKRYSPMTLTRRGEAQFKDKTRKTRTNLGRPSPPQKKRSHTPWRFFAARCWRAWLYFPLKGPPGPQRLLFNCYLVLYFSRPVSPPSTEYAVLGSKCSGRDDALRKKKKESDTAPFHLITITTTERQTATQNRSPQPTL